MTKRIWFGRFPEQAMFTAWYMLGLQEGRARVSSLGGLLIPGLELRRACLLVLQAGRPRDVQKVKAQKCRYIEEWEVSGGTPPNTFLRSKPLELHLWACESHSLSIVCRENRCC